MTTAYIDAFSGVSGDMLLGALVDVGLSLEELQAALDTLGVEGLRLSSTVERRSGIGATRVMVDYPPQHEHRHLKHIVSLIEAGSLPEEVKGRAVDVFLRLAEAEAEIHRIDPQRVHFHEVGAADAIADVVGTVFGFHHLGIDEILVGPVNVGGGLVRCEHGLLPVPAPATLALLVGWACRSAGPTRELTTPTGAALVTTLGRQVESFPALRVGRVGYGAGGADTPEWPNLLRVVLGEPVATGVQGPRPDEASTHQGIMPHEHGHEHRHDREHQHPHTHQH
jgi:pyridinium-3,5-bisthiocarboxylic acid mononucleotide nickel chelatase